MLTIRDLHFGYNKQIEILHGIDCEVKQGELVSVLGPNGCGKTTLVKCINRIHDPWSGRIQMGDKELQICSHNEIAKRIGYLSRISALPIPRLALQYGGTVHAVSG